MKRDQLIEQIKKKALQDKKKRKDRRFLETMGFLVAKGFLHSNLEVPLSPNIRLQLDDAIWAGQNVEPRILEVLAAAVLRLDRHFDLDPVRHPELFQVVEQLRKRQAIGDSFFGVPYEKLKVWAEHPLPDRRVKAASQKKVMKTFRLDPAAVDQLKRVSEMWGCSETEVLESLLKTSKK